MNTVENKEEKIRERAYQIWEREGRPHGRDGLHWQKAEEEIASEERRASQPSSPSMPLKSKERVSRTSSRKSAGKRNPA
ncbi:MAG TPA: DUF2934 domain-containing protein [Alphaproteobacteria bacterium]|nr:DUF2934 domain-containing protein [Alphaproteobacteria bacterium]